ncbi:MAG TPA: cytochrome ubiquinol oxidase subunit I [Desulfuromonadales bacterium]
MDNVIAARALMGVSLGFHIIYATIGIGLPLMLMLAEGLSLRTGDERYHRMARRWIRPAGLLFAIGAVSGTILSFELGFLWPRFMEQSGPLIGLPFWLEGYAFFLEAIFLGLYAYGGRRLSRRTLFLCTIPLTVAAAASAVFVISANAWMNTPAGFRLEGGILADIDPLAAMANQAWAHQAVHGTLAAYAATGFAMAGIYALALLRGRAPDYGKKALVLALAVAGLSLPLMLISGDRSAAFLARHEKAKLAAAEAHFETRAGAPLIIGGWPDPETRKVRFGIEIPGLLSLFAFRDPDAVVTGLDGFPPDEVPDPRLVHTFFDLMVASFFFMAAVAAWFWWRRWREGEVPTSRRLLWSVVLAAPFGMIALESGWLVTEFGRQPWIVHGVMRVESGVTPNAGMGAVFLTFITVYAVLTVGLLQMLLRQPASEQEGDSGEARHDQP